MHEGRCLTMTSESAMIIRPSSHTLDLSLAELNGRWSCSGTTVSQLLVIVSES